MLFHNIYFLLQSENLLNKQSIILISMKACLSPEQNEFPQVPLEEDLFSLRGSFMLGGRCSNPFISVSLETLSVFSYISPMLFEYIVKECSYQVIFFMCTSVE